MDLDHFFNGGEAKAAGFYNVAAVQGAEDFEDLGRGIVACMPGPSSLTRNSAALWSICMEMVMLPVLQS